MAYHQLRIIKGQQFYATFAIMGDGMWTVESLDAMDVSSSKFRLYRKSDSALLQEFALSKTSTVDGHDLVVLDIPAGTTGALTKEVRAVDEDYRPVAPYYGVLSIVITGMPTVNVEIEDVVVV